MKNHLRRRLSSTCVGVISRAIRAAGKALAQALFVGWARAASCQVTVFSCEMSGGTCYTFMGDAVKVIAFAK